MRAPPLVLFARALSETRGLIVLLSLFQLMLILHALKINLFFHLEPPKKSEGVLLKGVIRYLFDSIVWKLFSPQDIAHLRSVSPKRTCIANYFHVPVTKVWRWEYSLMALQTLIAEKKGFKLRCAVYQYRMIFFYYLKAS